MADYSNAPLSATPAEFEAGTFEGLELPKDPKGPASGSFRRTFSRLACGDTIRKLDSADDLGGYCDVHGTRQTHELAKSFNDWQEQRREKSGNLYSSLPLKVSAVTFPTDYVSPREEDVDSTRILIVKEQEINRVKREVIVETIPLDDSTLWRRDEQGNEINTTKLSLEAGDQLSAIQSRLERAVASGGEGTRIVIEASGYHPPGREESIKDYYVGAEDEWDQEKRSPASPSLKDAENGSTRVFRTTLSPDGHVPVVKVVVEDEAYNNQGELTVESRAEIAALGKLLGSNTNMHVGIGKPDITSRLVDDGSDQRVAEVKQLLLNYSGGDTARFAPPMPDQRGALGGSLNGVYVPRHNLSEDEVLIVLLPQPSR